MNIRYVGILAMVRAAGEFWYRAGEKCADQILRSSLVETRSHGL